MRNILRGIGRAIHSVVNVTLALFIVAGGIALANYAVTQGTGTNFGSIVVGGTVHYAQQLICDQTTPTQCAGVNASNELKVVPTGTQLNTTTSGKTGSISMGAVTTDPTGALNGLSPPLNQEPLGQLRVAAYSPMKVQPIDCSGTISTGGTAQNALAASDTRRGYVIANISTAEVMWVSFTTTAAADTVASYPLPPGTTTTLAGFGSFASPMGFGTNAAVSVIAATTGHKFSCTTW